MESNKKRKQNKYERHVWEPTGDLLIPNPSALHWTKNTDYSNVINKTIIISRKSQGDSSLSFYFIVKTVWWYLKKEIRLK